MKKIITWMITILILLNTSTVIASNQDLIKIYDIKLSAELQWYTYKYCQEKDFDFELALAVMQVESTFRPYIAVKNSNSDVEYLQQCLNTQGYICEIDGVFGARTLFMVKQFQFDYGLLIDGIVGNNTWATLTGGDILPMLNIDNIQYEYDQGLMQINSLYEKWFADIVGLETFNALNPYDNIQMGISGLCYFKDRWEVKGYEGDMLIKLMLNSYNIGEDGVLKILKWNSDINRYYDEWVLDYRNQILTTGSVK